MIHLLFSNFRANFDVHLMEQKFLNVASIFIQKYIFLKGLWKVRSPFPLAVGDLGTRLAPPFPPL